MKASEWREKSDADLQEALHDLREGLCRLRIREATEDVPAGGRRTADRKDIARILTVLNERERQAAAEKGE